MIHCIAKPRAILDRSQTLKKCVGGIITEHLAIQKSTEPRTVSIPDLQKLLVRQGQVIRHAKH